MAPTTHLRRPEPGSVKYHLTQAETFNLDGPLLHLSNTPVIRRSEVAQTPIRLKAPIQNSR